MKIKKGFVTYLLVVAFIISSFGAVIYKGNVSHAEESPRGWVTENGTTYYYNSEGRIEKNCYIDGYWLNADGSWTYPYKSRWQGNDGNWWYGDSSGWYAKNSWYKIDGEWYYFDLKGYMCYDCFIGSSYVNDDGIWKETENTEWAANISDNRLAQYFRNSVVVGDSVCLGFNSYCTSSSDPVAKQFTFMTKGCFGIHNAIICNSSVTPSYNGSTRPIWESISASGTDHVYLSMGLNDIYQDTLTSEYETLIDKIWAYSPNVEITVCSITGVVVGGEKTHFTNADIDSHNYKIRNMCKRKGCTFIDLNAWVSDGTGLYSGYVSDGFVHQNNASYARWLEAFKSYGRAELVKYYDGE